MPSKKTETHESKKLSRAPIVTIMGHVDHGKTSLLDAIRKTNVQSREYGGITQHIGAYQIIHKGNPITFIDTPGHAAFTQMRARGGRVADIVVLVVAADDGVQPQTVEAISHAKAASTPMIVAINKIDSDGADINKVKQMLSQENVLVEDWGGEVIVVETSAIKGTGLEKLLDAILALAEVLDIKGDSSQELEAMIIEAKKDSKRGVSVSAIIRNGTLKIGDEVNAGGLNAKIKSMVNDKGEALKTALPSTPIEILGFSEVPHVGDLIVEKGSELAELSKDEFRVETVGRNTKRTVGIIIRADTQGTLEAVKASLAKLVSENVNAEFSLKFLLESTGSPTDSDVLLASSAKGLIVGFNVKIPTSVEELALEKKVSVKAYRTIYDLIDEVKDVLIDAAFDEEAKIKGRAKVNKIFKLPSGDIIAGCLVLAGALKDTSRVSIYEKDPADLLKTDVALYNGNIKKLKKQKDEVAIVGKDNECGVLLKPQFDDIAEGMFIEVR
ncbi:translation initiation factor IF-2 [candidate division WWE3 bacterium]|nr:translation initiation factor IF-2 [candidate division WWE3 bacterium]